MDLLTGFPKRIILSLFILIFVFSVSSNGKKLRPGRRFSDSLSNNDTALEEGQRKGKSIPFFAFVTFPSGVCKGDTGESGVCMKKSHCAIQGGKDSGTCAMGYGTCCIISKACSADTVVINTNGTQITQGSTFEELCRFEIPKQNNVCQVRLDFEEFNIDEGPDAEIIGNCASDTLTISGNSNGMLGPLCGNLNGQHMYLDYGANDKINLDIYLTMDMGQKWNILVTMIKCDSPERAPDGCLQYYTAQRGTVKSFNYNLQHQLNDQDYAVCVRTNPGMKKITWKTCGNVQDFVISGGPPALPLPGEPGEPIFQPMSGSECTTDWVMIFGDNKYCGSGFPASVSSMTQPFMMQVHFDHYELPMPPQAALPDDSNTGFCLMYTQSPY